MKIEKLKRENKQWIDEGAELLIVCFEHAWDIKEEALEEMEKFVQEERGGALVAVEPFYQSKGIGTKLVAALEEEVYKYP